MPVVQCPTCREYVEKPTGAVNRSNRLGAPIYCSRKCAGTARRKNKTKAQLVEDKRLYDEEYRASNRGVLKRKKAEYFQRTYDPAKAAVKRKKRAAAHAEYCRRPEYRAWKSGYDKKYRAIRDYGAFADVYLLLRDLDEEILSRLTRYEISIEKGNYNKCLQRRREYEKLVGR